MKDLKKTLATNDLKHRERGNDCANAHNRHEIVNVYRS